MSKAVGHKRVKHRGSHAKGLRRRDKEWLADRIHEVSVSENQTEPSAVRERAL